MPHFLRLIIWDALFFLILSVGYAASQSLGGAMTSYVAVLLTCVVCGIFLAQLAIWRIGWMELILVGLPALYLALAPLLAPLLNSIEALPFPLVPSALLKDSAMILHLAGGLTAGFLVRQKLW